MKYNVGDKVRIKSLDWYNENKDENGNIYCGDGLMLNPHNAGRFCGRILTIKEVNSDFYTVVEDCSYWNDNMIEGLAEETEIAQDAKTFSEGYNQGYDDGQHDMNEWVLPEGYQFVDENSNVINASKIVLEKKKPKCPQTFLECCDVLNIGNLIERGVKGYEAELFDTLQKLFICRDAYWKIAGEEMGLGKPWEPDWRQERYIIYRNQNDIIGGYRAAGHVEHHIFEFPTKEMRDEFKMNFGPDIDICKKLL